MLTVLLGLMGKIALLVALGYCLRRWEIITEQFQKGLTTFMMEVALTASVLTTSQNPFSLERARNLLLTAAIACVYFFGALALVGLLRRWLPMGDRGRNLFVVMAVFANTAFIGFPLTEEVAGQEGMLYAVIFNMVWMVFFYTAGVALLTGQKKFELLPILRTPVAISSIAAIVIYVSPLRFPAYMKDTLSSVGDMVVPLSMMLIGCSLVGVRPRQIFGDPCSYAVSALRLLVLPFLAMGVLWLIPGIPNLVALVCSLLCALPSASLCVVFSQQYQCEPTYASRAVVQGMVLMVVTIPVIVASALAIFPI